MVDFLTPDLLRREAGRLPLKEEAMVRKASRQSPVGATFLSHSSADADRLPYIITILEQLGGSVYIDKKDQTLPAVTSRDTADALKERIISCHKFVLLTSPTSKNSRWMPWELGLADGFKGTKNVAILPSPEQVNDQTWADQEYLGVYDRIVFAPFRGTADKVFMVQDHEANTAISLNKWLKQ